MKPSVIVFPIALVLLVALAGCPPAKLTGDGGVPPGDGGVSFDAPPPERDAAPGVDAAVPVSAPPAAMVLSAGGRVTGPTFTLEVQIGEALVPRPVSDGELVLAPHGAIQP